MIKIKYLNPLSLPLFLLLLYGFTAGCIDSATNGENPISDPVPETLVTDINDLIPDRMNTF